MAYGDTQPTRKEKLTFRKKEKRPKAPGPEMDAEGVNGWTEGGRAENPQ